MAMRTIVLVTTALALAACGGEAQSDAAAAPQSTIPQDGASQPVSSEWTLDPAASAISFMSIKAGDGAENHGFGTLTGKVGADGAVRIEIALDSVETNVDIRNERMREMFFETTDYPVAVVNGAVDLGDFAELAVGESAKRDASLSLDLHGQESAIDATLTVTRIGENRVLVATAAPVVVHVADFGLQAGLDALRDVAGLPSITPVAPVYASLVFAR